MPVNENGVGTGDHTPEKHKIVEGVMRMHLNIVHAILKKGGYFSPPFQYVDLTAGMGEYEGKPTAPVVVSQRCEKLGLKSVGISYERNETTYTNLQTNLQQFPWHHVTNNDFCGRLLEDGKRWLAKGSRDKGRLGLMYYDPTGSRDFVKHMQEIRVAFERPQFKHMDFLMHIQAASIKRLDRCEESKFQCCIDELIAKIPKKQIVIREPVGAHQFTFILASNWLNYPAWENANFAKIDSPSGRDYINRICLTRNELEGGARIEIMPSTSNTPSFSRCEES